MMKFGRVCINTFVVFFCFSCAEKKGYDFEIIELSKIDNKIVDFKFRKEKTNSFKTVSIDLNSKQQFLIDKDYNFAGFNIYDNYKIFFYPRIYSLQNGGKVEAYFYKKPKITKIENVYSILSCEGIDKYFLYFKNGEKIISIISSQNSIDISDITNNVDFTVTCFDKSDLPILFKEIERNGYVGGYIVKSRIDGTLLNLD